MSVAEGRSFVARVRLRDEARYPVEQRVVVRGYADMGSVALRVGGMRASSSASMTDAQEIASATEAIHVLVRSVIIASILD